MAYIEVDVELDVFDDQELIDELEERGWFVGPDKDWEPDEGLTDEEKDVIVDLIKQFMVRIGSIEYNIYEKLRKR